MSDCLNMLELIFSMIVGALLAIALLHEIGKLLMLSYHVDCWTASQRLAIALGAARL